MTTNALKSRWKTHFNQHVCVCVWQQVYTVWSLCDSPVKVIVVILSFTPEIEEYKTQEEGEDQEAKTATLHL